MKAFKNLLGKKASGYIRNGKSKSIPVWPAPGPKAYDPDGKSYFCIMARSNEREIKLDVLSTDDSKDGRMFQDIKYGSVSLTAIATVDVILSEECLANGSISIKYNGTEYSAANLYDNRGTHFLDMRIDFYNGSAKHGVSNYYASYQGEYIRIYHGTNGAERVWSPDDYVKITHTLKNNIIEFYVGKEKIAQIFPQIFPWEPRYVGWVLDSYQSDFPFLAVRLVIDWFQYGG